MSVFLFKFTLSYSIAFSPTLYIKLDGQNSQCLNLWKCQVCRGFDLQPDKQQQKSSNYQHGQHESQSRSFLLSIHYNFQLNHIYYSLSTLHFFLKSVDFLNQLQLHLYYHYNFPNLLNFHLPALLFYLLLQMGEIKSSQVAI